jgi:hypothetical protein
MFGHIDLVIQSIIYLKIISRKIFLFMHNAE